MKWFILLPSLFFILASTSPKTAGAEQPNILWITTEDIGPNLGCYGDDFARTPHLDTFAQRGQRFLNAWSNAPVCAPARTTIIAGTYPTSTGSEHMRSDVPMPAGQKMYAQFLREAGYYCTNNNKEDYNLTKPDGVWDESSKKAHWKNRAKGQPFFAVFNFGSTHESQNRKEKHQYVSDVSKVPLPPYHPDTPEVRQDWAQYYDNISVMDGQFQQCLDELASAGLAEDTIIFFYGDHGAGMPRHKRWPGNTGLKVPFIVHFPKKWQHLAPKDYAEGAASAELISFVDLAPSLLSLTGTPIPSYLQGRAFCGQTPAPAPLFLHGFRSRMDERIDMMRSVTDGRYVYIRHYMPHVPYAEHVSYLYQMPTMQVWQKLAAEKKLNPIQNRFWEPKVSEELYDTQSDPWETMNLADESQHQAALNRLRDAHSQHTLKIRDLGFMPEAQRLLLADGKSPQDALAYESVYPLKEILPFASLASDLKSADTAPFIKGLQHPDATMRYWAAMGVYIRGQNAVKESHAELLSALEDASSSVRIMAAGALATYGSKEDQEKAMAELLHQSDLQRTSWMTAIEALNVLDRLDQKTQPYREQIAALPQTSPAVPKRLSEYVPRLLKKLLSDLQ